MDTTSETTDEFFGDQSSDAGSHSDNENVRDVSALATHVPDPDILPAHFSSNGTNRRRDGLPSDQFGAMAEHEARACGAALQSACYLDGYDETKEARLQEGFATGYRRSFEDTLRLGRLLGAAAGSMALGESAALKRHARKIDPDACERSERDGGADEHLRAVESARREEFARSAAEQVRRFVDEILKDEIGDEEYTDAISKLEEDLESTTNRRCVG